MAKITDYRYIPLDDLVISTFQVRKDQVNAEIEELVENIRVNGLLQPIMVFPSPEIPGKYEIIMGQRRVLAHNELWAQGHLDKPEIMAAVADEHLTEIEATVLSLSENMMRRDLTRKDLIDACTKIFLHYGDINITVQKTGLSNNKVREYVQYVRLNPELKTLVDTGEVDLKKALTAQDAARAFGGDKDQVIQNSVIFAKEISPMSNAAGKKFAKDISQASPQKALDEVIEEAKTGAKITQIIVTLANTEVERLQHYSDTEGIDRDGAAGTLILEGLDRNGF